MFCCFFYGSSIVSISYILYNARSMFLSLNEIRVLRPVYLCHIKVIIIRIYLTLKQNMGEQPTCDLWDETAKYYVDRYCENEGFIHDLAKTTTPTPEGLFQFSEQGCQLIL